MRRGLGVVIAGVCVVALVACIGMPEPTTVPPAPTSTVVPTATTTVTPYVMPRAAAPARYPTPTTDPRDPMYPAGTLRTANWPAGSGAVATVSAGGAEVDIAAVVLTAPVPEGATLAFYIAVPPNAAYAAHVSFPVSPEVMTLQPGETIRLIGRAVGAYPLPPLEGTGSVVTIIGRRFVRGDAPLSR